MVGSAYKVQKRDLYFKVFTQKKYSYWFEELLEDFHIFFKTDLDPIQERLDKIKDYSFKLIKPSIKFGIFIERIIPNIKKKCKFGKAVVKSLAVLFNDCFGFLNKILASRVENFNRVEKGLFEFTKELNNPQKKF